LLVFPLLQSSLLLTNSTVFIFAGMPSAPDVPAFADTSAVANCLATAGIFVFSSVLAFVLQCIYSISMEV
jgi:hypothetical protein